ncbi:class I SAM-dependent methyltransferase [Rhodoblastus sp.]|uniref:class I SAM-dependent methyltransferase n=1 Tax=Rhodoblastus sp. TaxID=1962975 RepID=UPI003F9524DB
MTEAREHTLKDDIGEIIADEGPISLERYMALALTHPTKGYYTSRDPFGVAGDFITAPEISQMFGELIGLWAAEIWSQIGSPPHVRLVELGPGRGALMADALRAARAAPDFFAAIEVELVEASDLLAARQSAALADSGKAANWRKSLDEIPHGPAIFIANEFFDALPVRQFLKTAQGWRERLIGVDPEGQLAFSLNPEVEPYIKPDAPNGAIFELGAAAQRLMIRIAARIVTDNGAALAIDYGYRRNDFGETLQAVKAHQFVDPLAEPGLADLTTHVDFSALARAAAATDALVHGPVDQGAFLRELGIVQRAEALKRNATPEQAAAVDSALGRLTGDGEGEMGALFKVLGVTRRNLKEAPGFTPAVSA